MEVFYITLAVIVAVLAVWWLWLAIDQYHMRSAVREAREIMRRYDQAPPKRMPPSPSPAVSARGNVPKPGTRPPPPSATRKSAVVAKPSPATAPSATIGDDLSNPLHPLSPFNPISPVSVWNHSSPASCPAAAPSYEPSSYSSCSSDSSSSSSDSGSCGSGD